MQQQRIPKIDSRFWHWQKPVRLPKLKLVSDRTDPGHRVDSTSQQPCAETKADRKQVYVTYRVSPAPSADLYPPCRSVQPRCLGAVS